MKKLKKNIYDYIKDYGCFNFEEKEFNEVDGIILSAFSYIDIISLNIKKQSKITLRDLTKKLIEMNIKRRRKYFLYDKDDELVKLMRISKRYGSLIVREITSFFDKRTDTQFFAITIDINDKIKCVVFRGTDKTLTGWKESLKLAYMDEVGGQKLAKEYLTNVVNKYSKSKFFVVGHSKGGNLAIYSYLNLDVKNIKKIEKVYNYDGPGLSKNNNDLLAYNKKAYKIENIVPKSSVIGMVYHNDNEVQVVDSSSDGIMQHIHYSWLIEKDHFKFLKKRTKDSKIAKEVLGSWLNSMTEKEKESFVKTLFSWTTKSKAKETKDLLNITIIVRIIKQAIHDSKETKESLSTCFSKLIQSSIEEVGKL